MCGSWFLPHPTSPAVYAARDRRVSFDDRGCGDGPLRRRPGLRRARPAAAGAAGQRARSRAVVGARRPGRAGRGRRRGAGPGDAGGDRPAGRARCSWSAESGADRSTSATTGARSSAARCRPATTPPTPAGATPPSWPRCRWSSCWSETLRRLGRAAEVADHAGQSDLGLGPARLLAAARVAVGALGHHHLAAERADHGAVLLVARGSRRAPRRGRPWTGTRSCPAPGSRRRSCRRGRSAWCA